MKCAECKFWIDDILPDTGEKVHCCACFTSNRLDDFTEEDEGCEYGQADA